MEDKTGEKQDITQVCKGVSLALSECMAANSGYYGPLHPGDGDSKEENTSQPEDNTPQSQEATPQPQETTPQEQETPSQEVEAKKEKESK